MRQTGSQGVGSCFESCPCFVCAALLVWLLPQFGHVNAMQAEAGTAEDGQDEGSWALRALHVGKLFNFALAD